MKVKFKLNNVHDINMAKVGKFDEYYLYIYSNEGINTPHFHLENIQDNKYVAIKLLKPEYFIHGKYKNKLNNLEIKDLIKFLNDEPYGKRSKIYKNNFDLIYNTWFYENIDKDPDKEIEIPNYRLLNNIK